MRKEDVQTHRCGYGGPYLPAVNVKCYHFPNTAQIAGELGIEDGPDVERAAGFAWDMAVERFWGDAKESAIYIWGEGVEVYAEGRSGGWAVVAGLSDIEDWDAIALGKWAKFARECGESIEYLRDLECVCDNIRANRWAEPGSELYNFHDGADGESRCMVDMKRDAVAAGFAPVVR